MRKESLIREATKVGERFRKTIHLSDLDILRTLGEGAFGRVRLVKHKETDVMYALKYLAKKNIVDNASQEHVSNEKTIMMMIDNAFVLKLYNSFQDKRYLYFLVELVRGGELFTLLRDEGSLPDKSARFYAAGVIEAFKSMHALCITYRDLKPENLRTCSSLETAILSSLISAWPRLLLSERGHYAVLPSTSRPRYC